MVMSDLDHDQSGTIEWEEVEASIMEHAPEDATPE
jgi:Ca2+-binding EF-hand superfamily protein